MKSKLLLCTALIGTAFLLGQPAPSSATLLSASALSGAADQLRVDTPVARVARAGAVGRGGAVRRTTVAGPRGVARRTTVVGPGGGVARRTTAVGRRAAVVGGGAAVVGGGAAVRRAGAVRYGNWVRPARYRWGPGGAIAAGAAIGFVSAVTAAAWAGAAPGPGLCWYYTDPSRTQGFWDACP